MLLFRTCRDDEISLLRKIGGLEDAVKALDAVVDGVHSEYFSARAKLCRATNARCSALARLPLEILAMIFDAACAINEPMEKYFTRNGGLHPRNPWRDRGAINLTCFYWRQVALRTGSLWNNLVIYGRSRDANGVWGDYNFLGSDEEDEQDKQFSIVPHPPLIPIILQRASAVPLNIHISCDSFKGSVIEKYWNMILPHINRAADMSRTFEIKLRTVPRRLGIFSEPSPLPKLRYLSLEWGARRDVNAECIDLSQAISITSLSITARTSWRGGILRVRLPEVCTLKTLCLKGSFALTDVTSAVTCCASQLEWLTLDISATPRMVQEAQIPASLRLSRLHELRVRGRFSVVLMRAMNAPRLQSLTIHSGGVRMDSRAWTRYPHPLSVTQQFPILVSLHVPSVPDDILTPYLAAHPSLETVGMVNITLARVLLFPDNSHSRPHILPNLRSLWMNCIGWQAEDVAKLRELVTHLRATSSSSAEPKCVLYLQGLPINGEHEFFQLARQFKEYIRLHRPNSDETLDSSD